MGNGKGGKPGNPKTPKDEIKEQYVFSPADLAEIMADLDAQNKKISLADDKLFEAEASENMKWNMQIHNYHKAAQDENNRYVFAQMAINDTYLKKTVEWDAAMDKETKKHQIEEQKIGEAQLAAYQKELDAAISLVSTAGDAFGASAKEKAAAQIPLEVAQIAIDIAKVADNFQDPPVAAGYAAAAAAPTLALGKLVEAAAGKGSGSAPSSVGGGSGGSSSSQASAAPASPVHRSTVVVNVGDGVVTNPKEFAKQIVLGLNEAYRDNVNIEFAG
jgi:hypothetical protein